jgi:3-oxoacyl-[acyl-carrier-protein] synthase III
MKSVSIKSICYYVPEGRMTNNEIIEKMLNESRECLRP